MQKSLYFECPRRFVVLPHRLELKANLVRVAHGQGESVHKRTNTGGSMGEYWGIREYTPGDPKRSISWKQSARLHKLVVVEHAQPIASKIWIWINTPSHHQGNSKVLLERQIALAASLAVDSSRRGIPVGIWAPAYQICTQPASGAAHLSNCLHRLAMIQSDQDPLRDGPPIVAHADSIVLVMQSSGDQAVGVSRRSVCFDVQEIGKSMIDPASLPTILAGAEA